MIIVLRGKQADEYFAAIADLRAVLADFRDGKIVRVTAPVPVEPAAIGAAPAVRAAPEPEALPDEVERACRQYGRGVKAYQANAAQAWRLLAAEVEPADVVRAIAQGK